MNEPAAHSKPATDQDVTVSEEALRKAEHYIEEEEGAANRLTGWLGAALGTVAVVMSLFHLYAAYSIVPTQTLRPIHVGFVLFLTFLMFPAARRFRHRVMWWDWIIALLSVAIVVYLIQGGDDFTDRNTLPNGWDIFFGTALILLVLEGMRRTIGWILPVISICFLLYAFLGPYLPHPWTHRGYDLGRIVGFMYMTLEGIYGVAVDVSSSLIILFTIFGAFLQYSGAGKFYIDFSFSAMGGKPAGAGRTVVLASFLLGGPSGSGVATTVTLGTVAWPMLAKVGYDRNAAGGLLAAGGLGAIISPPVMGAAAFIIAEFLQISYLDVLMMAILPTALFYLALFFMVEIDVRKYGMSSTIFKKVDTVWNLTRHYWFHFLSLISIVAFMLWGFSPVLSVFWATVVSFLTSLLRPDTSMIPYDLFRGRGSIKEHLLGSPLIQALKAGSIGMLGVGTTCAGAGIIVGVVTLTGLGLKFSGIVIDYAGGSLLLTAVYTALVVWIIGLAVPVTASYIICAVITAPALIKLGVPDFAAHMFIFYYAVLSEVSPPTALSPFAASAITGGDPYKTTMQCWKYTIPAFLVPFIFVLDPGGQSLLLMGSTKALAHANVWEILRTTATAATGIFALAVGFQGWLLTRTSSFERWIFIVAGFILVYPGPIANGIGFGLAAAALALHWAGSRRAARGTSGSGNAS